MTAPSPLRIVAALIGIAFFILGVSLAACRPEIIPLAVWLAILGLMILVGSLFERFRYKPLEPTAPAGSIATAERFTDPTTDKMVEVYFNPKTGERTYVADEIRADSIQTEPFERRKLPTTK